MIPLTKVILPILIVANCFCFGQNLSPSIENLNVSVDTIAKQINISFDLIDNELDDVEIAVKLSDDNGTTFFANISSITGDIGFPVAPGNGKQISFNYDPSIVDLQGYKIKIIADDHFQIDIQDIVDQVDSNRLRSDLQAIEGIRHFRADSVHLEWVKDFIEAQFDSNGLQTYRQPFIHAGYNAHNIIGRLPGNGDEAKTYIVDGHFDTVNNSPGADDNGSGTVGMLEAMRVLSQYNFEHSLKFIGFDFEETENNLGREGSLRYINDGVKNYEEIEGVVNFEMIGFYSNEPNSQVVPVGFDAIFPNEVNIIEADSNKGNFVTNVSNANSEPLAMQFDSAAIKYVPELKVITLVMPFLLLDLLRSDHSRFWDGGYKALMITDGANFRNLNYHSPNDTLENLNFTFMSNIVKASVATIAKLAKIQHSDVEVIDVVAGTSSIPDILSECNISLVNVGSKHLVKLEGKCNKAMVDIRIYNSSGQLLLRDKISQTQFMINTSGYSPGLYFAVFNDRRGYISKEFLVK